MDISKKVLDNIVDKILSKKELKNIKPSFVRKLCIEELSSEKKLLDDVRRGNERSSSYKELIKRVRKKLHHSCGMFQLSIDKKKEFLRKKKWDELLNIHRSTRERLSFYPELYEKIFRITSKPKSVLDLGCGLNPLSFKYMNIDKSVHYLASDVNKGDLSIVEEFFEDKNIDGETRAIDLTNILKKNVFKNIGFFDICFIFKTLHLVDVKSGHKVVEKLVKKIPARWVIASFSTKKLSGKNMKFERRKWFELMLERLGHDYNVLKSSNEIFYVINKNS